MKPARHEQDGASLMGRQAALGPHGEGEHGLVGVTGIGSSTVFSCGDPMMTENHGYIS